MVIVHKGKIFLPVNKIIRICKNIPKTIKYLHTINLYKSSITSGYTSNLRISNSLTDNSNITLSYISGSCKLTHWYYLKQIAANSQDKCIEYCKEKQKSA
jgi:hypothetical protein